MGGGELRPCSSVLLIPLWTCLVLLSLKLYANKYTYLISVLQRGIRNPAQNGRMVWYRGGSAILHITDGWFDTEGGSATLHITDGWFATKEDPQPYTERTDGLLQRRIRNPAHNGRMVCYRGGEMESDPLRWRKSWGGLEQQNFTMQILFLRYDR